MAGALAALFAMSIVAATLVSATVNEVRRVRVAELAAVDDAALDGAIRLALVEILKDPRRRERSFEGGVADIRVGDRAFKVEVRYESGKLDANVAPIDDIEEELSLRGAPAWDVEAVVAAIEVRRSDERPIGLLDEILTEVTAPECARRVLTTFGGRPGSVSEGDAVGVGGGQPFPRPVPGSRIVVTAMTDEGDGARGREAVFLITGERETPARIMDMRRLRGAPEEACEGGADAS
ncbi:MAG: hypothetical protein PVI23_12715 [Maricaulaceae bacterium]|jgi:hypothetical protein